MKNRKRKRIHKRNQHASQFTTSCFHHNYATMIIDCFLLDGSPNKFRRTESKLIRQLDSLGSDEGDPSPDGSVGDVPGPCRRPKCVNDLGRLKGR